MKKTSNNDTTPKSGEAREARRLDVDAVLSRSLPRCQADIPSTIPTRFFSWNWRQALSARRVKGNPEEA
jgi:hypothetical protein